MSLGDLFKPIWKNSNSEVRLDHLIFLSQTEKYKQGDTKVITIIKKLAINDSDERIITKALSLIRKPEDFKEILLFSKSASAKNFILKEIEKNFNEWGWDLNVNDKVKFLKILKDEKLIKELILREPELWEQGIEKIKNEDILCDIFKLSLNRQDKNQLQFLVDYVQGYSVLKSIFIAYQSSPYIFPDLLLNIQNKLSSLPEYKSDLEVRKQTEKWSKLFTTLETTVNEFKNRLHQNDFAMSSSLTPEFFSENYDSLKSSPAITEEMVKAFEQKLIDLKNVFHEWQRKKLNYDHSYSLATQLIKIIDNIESLAVPPNTIELTEENINDFSKQLQHKIETLLTQAEELIASIPKDMYSIPVISHSREKYIAKKNRAFHQIQEIKNNLLKQKEYFEKNQKELNVLLAKLSKFFDNIDQVLAIESLNSQLNTLKDEWDTLQKYISNNFSSNLFHEQEKQFIDLISQCKKKINKRVQKKVIEHKKFISQLNQEIKSKIGELENEVILLKKDPNHISNRRQLLYIDFQKKIAQYRDELNPELFDNYLKRLDELNNKTLEIQENINREQSINLDKRIKLCKALEESAVVEENKEKLVELVKESQLKWSIIGFVSKRDFLESNEKFKKICQKILSDNSAAVKVVEDKIQNQIQQKQNLIDQVKEIIDRSINSQNFKESDWKKLTSKIKTIIDEWKEIKILSDKDNRQLNSDFKNQLDSFYDHRDQYYHELNKERSNKLNKKKTLLEELLSFKELSGEDTSDSKNKDKSNKKTNWISLRKKLLSFVNQWQKFGVAFPFSENRSLDMQFYDTVENFLNHHGESLENRKQQKESLLVELHTINKLLQENKDPAYSQTQIRKLFDIKQKWDKIFPIFSKNNRKINDNFFLHYKKILDEHQSEINTFREERKRSLEEKKDLLKQLENILDQEIVSETAKKVIDLQQKWKNIGHIPFKGYSVIEKSFYQKIHWFFKQRRENYKKVKDIRQKNYDKKQEILTRVRYLMKNLGKYKTDKAIFDSHEKLKIIWEMNRQLSSQGEKTISKKIRDEIKILKTQWSEIGYAFSDKKLNDEFYGLIRSIKK